MSVSDYTISKLIITSRVWINPGTDSSKVTIPALPGKTRKTFDLLEPLREWLNQIEVDNPKFAHRLCRLIPAQCPFERQIKLFNRTLLRIPPLCKLNPVYDEVVALRFRALSYLADECGEDITCYC
ncbi:MULTISPECIES: Mo-dependent nitrogenase C-terminal domain-containing protein [Moorena]|uniref:Nitrogenase n=1 Tax=Moorena bouillonii PNG TaxID=568701 RepID=A0A1U7N5D9_9CYAN|nr:MULTISPECIES: Mo-dependent nitrogenase C-terminal domain-containing protein [Moorena]NEO14487.1 nitrogenase [Moorena sp. SIO3E8]NEQ01853.1 nitrogenase [Moorena sp. SIO3F7]OLT61169.1 nitrogenase [Moorena bouillonii PNG]